jgi:hypothetical protein
MPIPSCSWAKFCTAVATLPEWPQAQALAIEFWQAVVEDAMLAASLRLYCSETINLIAPSRCPTGAGHGLRQAVIDEVQRAPDLLLAIKESVNKNQALGRLTSLLVTLTLS